MYRLIAELDRRNRPLHLTGWILIAGFLVTIGCACFDTRVVTGLNPWLKPMKFILSFVLYGWTIAWLLSYLPLRSWMKLAIGCVASAVMLAEVFVIALQAGRGTTSHYNTDTLFDAALYYGMGVGICILTLLMIAMTWMFWALPARLPRVCVWGIRAGLVLFLLGLAEGWVMILLSSHTVGAADGGMGLPLVNWSLTAGDLRISHFLGLHALQILPMCAFVVCRFPNTSETWQKFTLSSITTGYVTLMFLTFVQAMAGVPLLAG